MWISHIGNEKEEETLHIGDVTMAIVVHTPHSDVFGNPVGPRISGPSAVSLVAIFVLVRVIVESLPPRGTSLEGGVFGHPAKR